MLRLPSQSVPIMPMRAFFLVLTIVLSLCASRAGWAAPSATQDPRSTIQQPAAESTADRPAADRSAASPAAQKGAMSASPSSAAVVTERAGRNTVVVQNENTEPKLEFQSFVFQATGLSLPLFGQEFFFRAPSTFAPIEDAPVSAEYVIGPGDEVLIRAWGQVDIDYRAKVDRLGNLNIPKVGVLHVAGTEYRQLNAYIRTAIGRVFKNFELNVSLGELRSIQIFLVGQARFPGSYTVSSMSTLLSALFASGGPSNKGSMRRIILRRNNQVVTEFDLYDFLLRGDKSRDARLLPGDVIQLLPVGPLAAVIGSVNSQAVFELKHGESLAHLLGAAGGLSTTAAGQRVTLERIVDRSLRKVEEFSLDTDGLVRQVRDGDIIRLYAISPKLENVVTLRGNVAVPANVPWRKGMRISDLIPDRAALLSPEYWLQRNAALKTKIDADSSFRPRVEGELNWNYAVIERMHPVTQVVTLIPFNLAKAVLQREPAANLLLEPGDVVTIFSREDIRQPLDSHNRFVRLEGEVRTPGLYPIRPGETVRQLLERLGGVTTNAYLFGTELTRASVRNFQQQRMYEFVARLDVQLQFDSVVRLRNAQQGQDIIDSGTASKLFIEALRVLQATGRVVLPVSPGARSINDLPDIVLEDGDRLYIPPAIGVVSMVGAVHRESSVSYHDGMTLLEYLAVSGGVTAEADEDAIYVQRADGSIWSKRQSSWLSRQVVMMPGDTIVVPYATSRTLWSKVLRDWAQIFYQFGIGVAAISSLTK